MAVTACRPRDMDPFWSAPSESFRLISIHFLSSSKERARSFANGPTSLLQYVSNQPSIRIRRIVMGPPQGQMFLELSSARRCFALWRPQVLKAEPCHKAHL